MISEMTGLPLGLKMAFSGKMICDLLRPLVTEMIIDDREDDHIIFDIILIDARAHLFGQLDLLILG